MRPFDSMYLICKLSYNPKSPLSSYRRIALTSALGSGSVSAPKKVVWSARRLAESGDICPCSDNSDTTTCGEDGVATETEPVKCSGDGGNPGGDDTGGVGLPVEDGVGDGLPSGGVGGGDGLP